MIDKAKKLGTKHFSLSNKHDSSHIRANAMIRALTGFGDWWTALLLREAFSGTRHFAVFQSQLGIARQTLINRLREMVDNDIFYLKPYQDRPVRYEYRLTRKGLDLYSYALMCWKWHREYGNRETSRLPHSLLHTACGHQFEPVFACRDCREEVTIHSLSWRDGFGITVPVETPARSKRHTISRGIVEGNALYEHGAFIMTDRWSHLILAWIFLGHSTFDAFESELGISPTTLAHRLRHLTEARLLTREIDPVDTRRVHYRLTLRGEKLFPISIMLLHWANRWMPSPGGPTTLLFHKSCGHQFSPIAACSACGEEVKGRDVAFERDEKAKEPSSEAALAD